LALENATGLWNGAALSSTANFCAGSRDNVSISEQDKSLLRGLADRVAEHAARQVQNEKRQLWRKHNDLESTRPLVFCDPENGWNEIITEDQLQGDTPLARRWEMVLRKELFWAGKMGDDKVIEPFFTIGYTHGKDDWGIFPQQRGGQGGSYIWEAALKDETDINKIHSPLFSVDKDTTEATVALADDTLGDLLEIRLTGVWWWSFGLTLDLSLWRGLEQIMIDMIDRPEFVHQLMSLLRDGYLHKLHYLEDNGLLSSNVDQYVGSGGFGYTNQLQGNGSDRITTQSMWGFCESQETVGVSPEMFAEFIYPYQLPFLERFGLNCYGCCEPLDARWQVIKNTPNLRRVSVSSWSDLTKMSSLLENKYLFSCNPAPADLAGPHINEDIIRKKIRDALQATRGCNLEIIMKDNHTLGNNPNNAVRWVEITRKEIEKVYG
jgi:hypothetical protein